jgi:threonine aldolase
MRQSGVVAAMGLYALRHNVDRLQEDHARARRLADALCSDGFSLPIREGQTDTNIVYFALPGDEEQDDVRDEEESQRRRRHVDCSASSSLRRRREAFLSILSREHGVRLSGGYGGGGGRLFRAVTHLDVDDDGLDRAINAILTVARAVATRSN